eukprot:TRINITY_DN37554_c0_g1_i1.p1 TRINITY_DN37554_c0_g1~~TRINITY_DN37554_c0_g1_i1.p1  ORF type:complete len:192 (+),score=63.32 TRINITY_DN37554_c0_g1_i1:85-660(+)
MAATAVAAAEAAAAAVGEVLEKEEEPAPPPPEDLELRSLLAAIVETEGREAAQRELGNAVKILRRLSDEPENAKLHEMRIDVLERAVGTGFIIAFRHAAFEERPASEAGAAAMVWQRDQADARDCLRRALHETQRAADLLLDPEAITFAEVSQLVSEGRTLPGIEDVDDKVLEPVVASTSTLQRPKKPWEK